MTSVNCQNCKQDFRIDPEDFDFYKKIEVPPPTFCPECRLERRLAFQNQRVLHKRTCDLCQKPIISMYPAGTPFPVYCMPCFESDQWNALDHGTAYDPSVSFFGQFKALRTRVPRKALVGAYSTWTNSEYNNMAHELKNCYLMFNSDYNENCLYGSEVERSQNCIDMTMADSCQFSYGCVGCMTSYQAFFCTDCESCNNVWFSKNLVGCSDCFGCINLRNKKHCIFNVQYTKEDYQEKLKSLLDGSRAAIEAAQEQAAELYLQHPQRYMHGTHNSNASGDYIYNSKNVNDSYIVFEGQECRYCMWLIVKPNKDCYDYTQFGENTQRVYEALTSGLSISDIKFCLYCIESVSRLTYCDNCYGGSADLFGCIGLKKKQYCILNKQYSKEEYEALLPTVIENMNSVPYADKKGREYRYGEFFPIELSVYGYNETDAQEFFPKSQKQILEGGYRWAELEDKAHTPTLSWKDLPPSIKDVPDTITKEVILCKAWEDGQEKAIEHRCTKAYRIVPDELAFYRKMNLPLPVYCPNSRHTLRMQKKNLPKFWERTCGCSGTNSQNNAYANTTSHFHGSEHCPNEFKTSYAPDRPEIVYCEACYQNEVV